jgi:hypothetical protein
MSSISATPTTLSSALLGSTTSTTSAGDWINPSGSDPSSWFGSASSATTQQLATDTAFSNAFATTLTNGVQGQGSVAGEAALSRIEAAIAAKQAQTTKSLGSQTASPGGGGVVQNLLSSLDNITINNGAAPPMSSSSATSGYSAVQNLMSSFDNITINTPSAGTGSMPQVGSGNPLTAVDQVIATPKFNVHV